MSKMNRIQQIKNLLRLISRIISLLFIGFFFLFFFGEDGYHAVTHFELHDAFLLISIPVIFMIGFACSFRNELIAGFLMLVSVLSFNVVTIIYEKTFSGEIEFAFLLIPSVLFICLYLIDELDKLRSSEILALRQEYKHLDQNFKITQVMMEVTPEILKDDSLDHTLQRILEKAIAIIPKAQYGSILIKNDKIMEFRASVGYSLEALQNVELTLEDMYQYKLGTPYDPAIVKNIFTFNYQYLDPKKAQELDFQNGLIAKAVLTCAIINQNEIYGYINLDNIDDENAWVESDKIYIKNIASQIEIALKNQILIENIYKLSRYDTLTGAYARMHHNILLKELFDKSRKKNQAFTICSIDINDLKPINDNHGHEYGDAYLVHFSSIVMKYLDESTIFSRTGGDEFIIVYPDCNLRTAQLKIKALRSHIDKAPFTINAKVIPIIFGCGIATFPNDSEDLENLIRLSDQRMYQDKIHQK